MTTQCPSNPTGPQHCVHPTGMITTQRDDSKLFSYRCCWCDAPFDLPTPYSGSGIHGPHNPRAVSVQFTPYTETKEIPHDTSQLPTGKTRKRR